MDWFIGTFRCLLPRRYWDEMARGASASILLTAALGVRVGFEGFFDYARQAGEASAALALKAAAGGGAPGMSAESQATASIMGSIMVPISFFLFTPMGWITDYLLITAVFRAIALAGDSPWGDPVLTLIDNYARKRIDEDRQAEAARRREQAEGPAVPDEIVAGTQFAGKPADFVIVSSRVKEGWTASTTVIASGVRLRLGEPIDRPVKGLLRRIYPLRVIRDIQVDRRIVHYDWPDEAPPLPAPDEDPWERPDAEEPRPEPSAASAQTPVDDGTTEAERRNRMD